MNEIEGLTVPAIDWLIEGIKAQRGLIKSILEHHGDVCALGAIGFRETETPDHIIQKGLEVGLIKDHNQEHLFWHPAKGMRAIPYANNTFDGTPEERKEHMLNWLLEQRAFKCSSWTPPVREIVRKREAALA